MKRHDIIATHDLASTQALWKFNPEVAIKVAEAFRLVPSTSETTLEALLMELKKWKGDADGYRRQLKSLQAQHHEAVTWLSDHAVVERNKKGEVWRAPAPEQWWSNASLVAAAKCMTSHLFQVPLGDMKKVVDTTPTSVPLGDMENVVDTMASSVYQELADDESESSTPIPEARLRIVIGMVCALFSSVPCCGDNSSLQTLTNVGLAFL